MYPDCFPALYLVAVLTRRCCLRAPRFVEDRYETLEGVSLSMLGAPVSLYLADWGYNTERTRKRAARNPLVQVLSLSDFCTKMQ